MTTQHQVHYYLDLAKAIRAETDSPSIEIEATDGERENARGCSRSKAFREELLFWS